MIFFFFFFFLPLRRSCRPVSRNRPQVSISGLCEYHFFVTQSSARAINPQKYLCAACLPFSEIVKANTWFWQIVEDWNSSKFRSTDYWQNGNGDGLFPKCPRLTICQGFLNHHSIPLPHPFTLLQVSFPMEGPSQTLCLRRRSWSTTWGPLTTSRWQSSGRR